MATTRKINATGQPSLTEGRWQTVFKHMKDIVMVLDRDCRIRVMNHEQQGFKMDGVIGHSMFEFTPPEYMDMLKKSIATLFKKGTAFEHEAHIPGPDGSVLIYQSSYAPIFDEHGKINEMVVISRDITDMRNTEKRLLHAIFEGQEIERRRLSSDLHDGLGQYISALGFSMYRLEQDCKKLNITKPDKALSDVQALITRAGQELKSVTYNLSPQHLEQYGLPIAARDYCRQISALYGLKMSFRTRNIKDRLTPDLEIALYRLLQELLNNIIKHASAQKAEVSIIRAGHLLMLSVSDDGNGIRSANKKTGLGLQNIYNGKIIINSKIGKGTGVTISIPVMQVSP